MPSLKQESATDADEAEIRALREGESSVASAALNEQMAGEVEDIAESFGAKVPTWEREQLGVTKLTGDAIRIVEIRSKALENLYPFKVDRSSLVHQPSANGVYEYLLATSEAAGFAEKRYRALLRHFERIVRDLLVANLGDHAVGVRIGWPSEPLAKSFAEEDAPSTGGITRRIDWMKKKCSFEASEWSFYGDERLASVRKKAKDARIDVVVRRPLFDKRPGGITVIAQCGCGKHDVDESSRKHEELSDGWLNFFFASTSMPRPLKAFATSQHIVDDTDLFTKQAVNEQIVLDRLRLVKMANTYPAAVAGHIQRIRSLTADFVKS